MIPGYPNIINAVHGDPHLDNSQKQLLLYKLQQPSFFENLLHGAFGSALALLVAKYLKLSPTAQVLLGVAGFGIGKALWDANDNDNNFSRYNEQTKMYTIK